MGELFESRFSGVEFFGFDAIANDFEVDVFVAQLIGFFASVDDAVGNFAKEGVHTAIEGNARDHPAFEEIVSLPRQCLDLIGRIFFHRAECVGLGFGDRRPIEVGIETDFFGKGERREGFCSVFFFEFSQQFEVTFVLCEYVIGLVLVVVVVFLVHRFRRHILV